MSPFGVYPAAVSNPYFFCLTGVRGKAMAEEIDLRMEFFWKPVVIRIKKSDERADR